MCRLAYFKKVSFGYPNRDDNDVYYVFLVHLRMSGFPFNYNYKMEVIA